jgi:hypothetical protein
MRALLIAIGLLACEPKKQPSFEEEWVTKQVAELRTGLAARDEPTVVADCVLIESSIPKVPAKLGDEAKQLCHVEAPRLLLELAIAKVKKDAAENPEYPELIAGMSCIQLFVKDAVLTIRTHSPNDAALKALVDEYTKLCPAEAAKIK